MLVGLLAVLTGIAVVIMCGDEAFLEKFMILADKMGMTDPHEYVYITVLQNAVDASQLSHSSGKSRADVLHAFRPVLKVSYVVCMLALSYVKLKFASFLPVYGFKPHYIIGQRC